MRRWGKAQPGIVGASDKNIYHCPVATVEKVLEVPERKRDYCNLFCDNMYLLVLPILIAIMHAVKDGRDSEEKCQR